MPKINDNSISNKFLIPQELFEMIIEHSSDINSQTSIQNDLLCLLDIDKSWGFSFTNKSDLTISKFYSFDEEDSILDFNSKDQEKRETPIVKFECFLIQMIFKCLDLNYFNCIRCIKFTLENKLKREIRFNEIDEKYLNYSSLICNPPDIRDFFQEFKSMIVQFLRKPKRCSEAKKNDHNMDSSFRSNNYLLSSNLINFENNLKKNNSSFYPKIYTNVFEFLILKIGEILR